MTSSENDDFAGGEESLFEGMILFSPSDDSSPHPPPVDDEHEPQSESQPLDEDLFSDLTLTTDVQSLDSEHPNPTISQQPPPPPIRQISRKKKRAVRIGYARDSNFERFDSNVDEQTSEIASVGSSADSKAEQITEIEEERLNLDVSAAQSPDDNYIDEKLDGNSGKDESLHENNKQAVKLEEEEQSIDRKLNILKAGIESKINEIKAKAALLSSKRKELSRRRRNAMEKVNLGIEEYKALERELEEAVESEDFEKAERLSECMAEKEKEKDRFASEMRNLEVECDDCDLKMQEVLELQIVAEEEGVVLLEQFAKDAVDHADSVLEKTEELSSKQLGEWEALMEILEAKMMETETESQLINEARSGLGNSIEKLIEDDRREVKILKEKHEVLSNELGELLTLVRLKEAEIAKNEVQINTVEEKISNVVSNFHETQSSIDMKHDNLQSSLSKIDSEREALYIKKKEIDDFILQAQNERSRLRELVTASLDEAKTTKNLIAQKKRLAASILKSREDKVKFAKAEETILEEIQILRQQISSARTTLQELSSTRVTMQQEIASGNQRIAFIDRRGPELEAEKKVAAAARNFKEAGRIASEAKSLNIEKESLQNKIDKSVTVIEKLEEDIKITIDKIQENEALVTVKEKEAAIAGCKRLYLVAASAKAERLAAIEMGDLEEGECLLKEAESAEAKARELQENFGLELEENEKILDNTISLPSDAGENNAASTSKES